MSERSDASLIVGFSSDMGNAEDAAMSFAEAAADIGFDIEAIELNQIPLEDLQSVTYFVVVTSTFGEGEFPDNGTLFWESISAEDAERLEHLTFAVLALGDSGYDLFCNSGRILDERLEALGAIRLAERVDIDGMYEKPAAEWTAGVIKLLEAATAGTSVGASQAAAEVTDVTKVTVASAPDSATSSAPPAHSGWDRSHPYEAKLVVNRLLTAPESDKEVRHYEIDLGDSGIDYHAGDSIAVHPVNDPALVAAILAELGVGADYVFADWNQPLGELLARELEIRTPSRALQALVAARTEDAEAAAVLGGDDHDALNAWLYGRDVIDLLQLADLGADEVLETLRPLQFRDYSIASSALQHPDRVHLTVATVRHTAGDRDRGGVASTYLAERCESVQVHLRPNHTFRVPAPEVPIIMVGPGTGIAPFRAFLQERQATDASGKSWLFFGDRRRATDFLYGDELQGFVDAGVLTRLDLAFSRDRSEKDYVQHHMQRNSAELFTWLEEGAYLYVCGDADRMAKDVNRTLHEIVASAGGLDEAAAHAYVNDLIKSHRYVRDVY